MKLAGYVLTVLCAFPATSLAINFADPNLSKKGYVDEYAPQNLDLNGNPSNGSLGNFNLVSSIIPVATAHSAPASFDSATTYTAAGTDSLTKGSLLKSSFTTGEDSSETEK